MGPITSWDKMCNRCLQLQKEEKQRDVAALRFSCCVYVCGTKPHTMVGVQTPFTQTKIPSSRWQDLTTACSGVQKAWGQHVQPCSGG